MTKEEFKQYVLAEAEKYLAQEQDSTSDSEVIEEGADGKYINSEAILKLADEMKSINKSLAMGNPLISEGNIVDDIVGEDEVRKLTTPTGREYNIELKSNLNETMTNYNDQKKVIHKDTTSQDKWSHLVNYKRLGDE
ncbi:MAG: hypothetical protein P8J32_03350 [bacterium]|nr:hypothetical protein [bacterium]